MAAAVAGLESSVVAKSVEELSASAGSPPEKYILKDGIGGTNFPLMDVAVIDVALLTSSSPEGEREVEKLGLALSDCGYIQAVNHGIEESFLDEVHAMIKQFFSLPKEEKMKCARQKDDLDGYGNDSVYSDKQILDWNDRLYLMVKPEYQRKLKVWPQNPANFREVLVDLTSKLEKIDEVMLKAMARYLKLEDEECFAKQYGENPTALSRFNYYPPCRRPDAVLAAKAHADGSAMTYLLQDRIVEGLQTLKDGQWYKVPIVPNAIVVNVGDQMEIMSNGIFKSPTHRVVTNPEKERMTLGIFFGPDATTEIGVVEELVDEKRPRLYKSVVDYPRNTFPFIQLGKKPIDLVRL
ncbi:protein SRG1-like [Salvia miltiorrhiza]|uniref:protein SRG1-like n=1 Tax=Salvia miltiorrhiza TaxID=226208 RepID=UPI0025ABA1EE|nr:protein SRG1-like [Salvia miltiorrhiza]